MKKKIVVLAILTMPVFSAWAQWNTSGSHIYNSNTGNVGIGGLPSTKLDVGNFQNGPVSNVVVLRLRNTISQNQAANWGSALEFFNLSNNETSDPSKNEGGAKIISEASEYGWSHNLKFRVVSNSSYSSQLAIDALVINPAGKIGVGTLTPNSKFDIHVGNTSSVTTGLSVYRNSDPNLGINVMTGTGDGASYSAWNGGLGSWYGIAFHSTLDGITRGIFNVRDGSFSMKGNLTSEGSANIFGNAVVGQDGGPSSMISGPAFSGAIQIKTHSGLGGPTNRYLRLGYKDNAGTFVPVLAVNDDSNVGIGTTTPDAKLAVKGLIHTQELNIDVNGAMVPDYVFDKTYDLKSLSEVETFIIENKHLPEVPSASEMEKTGMDVKVLNLLLMKKIEELTLYMIELKKENEKQNELIGKLLSEKKSN